MSLELFRFARTQCAVYDLQSMPLQPFASFKTKVLYTTCTQCYLNSFASFEHHMLCMIRNLFIINVTWTLSFRLNSKGGILFYNQCYLSSFVSFTPNVPYTIYNQCYLNSFVSFEHNMMCAVFKIFIINVTWTLSFRLNTKCCILPMINVTWTLSDQKLGFRAVGSKVKGLWFRVY